MIKLKGLGLTRAILNAYTVIIVLFLFSNQLEAQIAINEYDKGFKVGFKEGYCYNSGIGCMPPITPLTPLTRLGESLNSYKDGYNRGFQIGIDLQRINVTNNLGYLPSTFNYPKGEVFKSSEYVPPVNLALMANVLARKQALFDSRFEWVQNNLTRLSDLAYSILKIGDPKYYQDVSEFIDAYIKALNMGNFDYSQDYLIDSIKDTFRYIENKIFENYSLILKASKGQKPKE